MSTGKRKGMRMHTWKREKDHHLTQLKCFGDDSIGEGRRMNNPGFVLDER